MLTVFFEVMFGSEKGTPANAYTLLAQKRDLNVSTS
jgi:hypothetical protein